MRNGGWREGLWGGGQRYVHFVLAQSVMKYISFYFVRSLQMKVKNSLEMYLRIETIQIFIRNKIYWAHNILIKWENCLIRWHHYENYRHIPIDWVAEVRDFCVCTLFLKASLFILV